MDGNVSEHIIKTEKFKTFSDKYVRNFIPKSVKGGRIVALNRYYESNHCEEILDTIRKHLKIKKNEISYVVDEYLKYIRTKRDAIKLDFENAEKDYRKINNRDLEKILD